MKLKTLTNTKLDLTGKKILLRVAYDIKPINGKLPDISRIQATLPTIKYLLKKNTAIFLLTWVGRPQGKDKTLSTKPHAQTLEKLLHHKVTHLPNCLGSKVEETIQNSKPGEIYMLENVRFQPQEGLALKDDNFAKQLSLGYNLCIFDAFSQAHRDTPSTTGIQKYLPTTAGFDIEKELENLSGLLKNPKSSFTIIIGGAKIKDKLGVIKNLINKTDHILIGGGAANPLLAFTGIDIKNSLTEKIKKPHWLNSKKIHLPQDYLSKNGKILDIGPKTTVSWQEIIKNSKTILWSGPLGLYEEKLFEQGTKKIAQAIAESKTHSIIGGGDTISAINKLKIPKKFTHISLAGGAMLALLAGKQLHALKPLLIKKT